MDIRQLRYFKAIVECGSVSLAARRLYVAQPALSVHVRTLESELSCTLFERHRGGVRPTAAGQALYAEAVAIVERLEAIPLRLAAPDQTPPLALRVGFIPTALFSLLGELAQCTRELPLPTTIDALEGSSAQLLQALAQGELDAAFVRVGELPPGVHVMAQREDPYVVALHAEHPLSRSRRPIDLGRIRDMRLICLGRDQSSICHDQAMSICFAAGFDPRGVHYVSNFASALLRVAAGLGVAIVPTSAALGAPAGVTLRSIAQSDVHSRLQFVRRAGQPLTSEADILASISKRFVALDRECVRLKRAGGRRSASA